MTTRRLRLSIESLDDRITPASAADLTGLAQQTVGTAMLLQEWSKNPIVLASPAVRPAVQSYFTGVYQQATTTLSLIAQFPGTLPAAEQQVVSGLAQIQLSVAQSVAARLGFTVTAAAPTPTPTPTPGAASATRSTVAVAPSSVAVGQTATVTLRAKDANGTNLTTGGATVVFALGTGTAVGTVGPVTDNHNGTYTATFTASTAGSNSIKATLDGQAVTATAPITVTAATTGTPSAAKSTVAASPASVAVGQTSTVALTAKDASGTSLTTGGATVTLALGAGTAVGTVGPVTDNHDGTYTATFTASTVGSNTIAATINGQAVTTTAATITVTAANTAPPSAAQSTVDASPASVAVGQTSTVTLTAKDASGANVTNGGATVAFALGTGTTIGTLGPVTDNHNGTYTATFTATAAGSNTVTATINGQAVTTPAPTLTVTTGTAPGTPDPAQSRVAASPTSVAVGGTSTVTLSARDASGVPLTTGGATVTFGLGTGTTIGSFGPVTDNHNGTYSATFTGATAGSDTVTATINGQAVTSPLPTVTVTTASATPDLGQSLVAVSPASVATGGTGTVTLTARDAGGTPLTTGGATVAFALGTGTTVGTIGPVTDNHNGTYTATFTGTTAGSNTITATIGGQAVTSSAPTITVTTATGPGPVDPTRSAVAASPASIPNGGTSTVTLTARDASGTALTTGGSTVAFALNGGTAAGSFGTVTDNHNGTYSATFTGSGAGTSPIATTIDGQAVTTTAPLITVTAVTGTADLARSAVALSPPSILSGGTSVVTLTARNSAGTQLTTGGSTVTFALGTGSAAGTFDTVVDNHDGTYTANFTGTGAGTSPVIGSIDGQPLTSTAPTLTVT